MYSFTMLFFNFYVTTMEQYYSSFVKITSLGQDLIDAFESEVNVEGAEKHSTEKG